jgi:hypothetical protein
VDHHDARTSRREPRAALACRAREAASRTGGAMSDATKSASLNLGESMPELLGRYLKFFRPAHEEGVVPARIKEIARLKIAALNDCDT